MAGKSFSFAFKSSLPVMAGYVAIGIGFGMLSVSRGFAWWWAPLTCVIIYAGASQFVVMELISGGASLLTVALMTLAVNFRHLFYGVAVLGKYRGFSPVKPYLIYALSDETFSLVCSPEIPEGADEKQYCFFVSLLNQAYWILGSAAGSLAGGALSFNTEGIDFAMTALFTVIFAEQWEKAESGIPAVTGLCVSLVCLIVLGESAFLIPALLIITAALFAGRSRITGRAAQ